EELRYWKESEIKLWGPILDFMQRDKTMKLGESISEEVLRRISLYNDLMDFVQKVTIRYEYVRWVHNEGSALLTKHQTK
ncbi:MAG TPA: hypothetical protein VFD46_07095, partial [Chryseolinea sp.]|nr:hypothetical protein [Chryseolinea sp.]